MTVRERFESEQVRWIIGQARADGHAVATIVAALAIFGRRIDGRPWAEADVRAVLGGGGGDLVPDGKPRGDA